MTWLITGGAGYIGSHVVREMTGAGERVVVLDDLSSGRAARLPADVPLVHGDVLDRDLLDRVMREHGVAGVVHIAARKQVGESVERPLEYYGANVEGLRVVLAAAAAAGVGRFLFSSSAAVYGMTDVDLVTEDTPCAPMSPYGETKLAGEWLVQAAGRAHGMATACLRYFNVAGAAVPELADTGVFNLIPMVFDRLTTGEAPVIFGDDYPTPDGTCERDYVHVEDIASAHLAAARRLTADAETRLVLNVGRGEGASVAEMCAIILDVTGRDGVEPAIAPRRAGDPARVVASAELAMKELGWSARYGVREMVESAWQGWCLHHPEARR
ncbi:MULTISPECIES: UDP-glucose 4-epimerase GalE [Glycomyces]|uniref:UDP-glucose 4-epimerase n=2 Tax=Glycomyces TaxID=58113 RepID=A0A9X3PIY3_9ACTN|nr:UDP-glucose 4-epimerase GalE [Glycomyces lechevalierae]MDA1386140.1 UDP-glucose 4-epimerase GalE [Glycomyces lechevalierae]MDR7338386.1 UDP-glucose 4-epimerase [Glycomyces lechevalierae]